MVSAPFLADCLNTRERRTLHPMMEDLDDEVLAVSSCSQKGAEGASWTALRIPNPPIQQAE